MPESINLTPLKEKYLGEALLQKYEKGVISIAPYFPDSRLVESVNLAWQLNRPLLLKGEPGCGKTKLAQAVAFELYGERYKEKYFEWNIKSTSKSVEGLYRFDHVLRLRDAQLKHYGVKQDAEKVENYRTLGELGKAFQASKNGAPSIILIDEIDKADIDFPNDLLLELDQKRFKIPEVNNEEIVAQQSPIIFITSNDEKELPQAFLRRCLFHYVDFPTIPTEEDGKQNVQASLMYKIVEANFPKLQDDLRVRAVKRFYDLRSKMQLNSGTDKRVSTSELIDWVRAIERMGVKIQELDNDPPVFSQILLKTINDYRTFGSEKSK